MTPKHIESVVTGIGREKAAEIATALMESI